MSKLSSPSLLHICLDIHMSVNGSSDAMTGDELRKHILYLEKRLASWWRSNQTFDHLVYLLCQETVREAESHLRHLKEIYPGGEKPGPSQLDYWIVNQRPDSKHITVLRVKWSGPSQTLDPSNPLLVDTLDEAHALIPADYVRLDAVVPDSPKIAEIWGRGTVEERTPPP